MQKLAEDRFALPRADVEQVLRDPTDILSQARFLPRYEGEDMVGFQINSIKQDSVLREFGIADGDLITRFNGISITSPAESARLLQEFNESDSITLDVMRPNGDTDTIQVEMND